MSTNLATLHSLDDHDLRVKAATNREALAEYRSRLTDRARQISSKSDEDLRLEAVKAANERDVEKLWEITEAYIVTKGRKKANTSLGTLDAYRLGIERLLKHWQGENLLRPSRDAGERYVGDLQVGKHGDRPLEPGTIQVRLAAARALYRALRWTGATKEAPFEHVAAPPDPTAPEDKRTAYLEEDIDRLLYVSDHLGAVLILLGADAGLRASEMINLRWADINFAAAEITVRDGKGGKTGKADASPALIEALQEWKAVKEPSTPAKRPGYVTPFATTAAARLRLRALADLAGVKYLGLHSLRHSCGTWLAKEEGIRTAQKQLRHSSSDMTEVYAKMDRSSIKNAMKRRRTVLRRRREPGEQPPA